MDNPDKIPVRFYFDFLAADWQGLPASVKRTLSVFLEELEKNPDNPDLIAKCETEGNSHFAYSFYPGYALYWRVIRKEPGPFIELGSCAPIRIEVLELRKT